jgi:hypothetical protein
MSGATGTASKYRVSPLAEYDRAVETASALLALHVSAASITFELRREHAFNEAQSAAVIRDARCVTTA